MANPEHVAKLKEGVEAWNEWRLTYPEPIDLSGADFVRWNLSGADLNGADLYQTNLYSADLSATNLYSTNLHSANLRNSDLSGANLGVANLTAANLSNSYLRGANLDGANLYKGELYGANIRGSTLREASICLALLSGVDLSESNLNNATIVNSDLNRATLSAAKLEDANLRGADLRGVNLADATLRGAHLQQANLGNAEVIGVGKCPANLRRANFSKANLISVSLDGADLRGASFEGADLNAASLHDVILLHTIFGDTNLSQASGLETCNHLGPCILDHATISKSGQLPLAFLRGCGLPDNLITYIPSLLNQPIQFYSCFISYSTEDQEFADRLHADLQDKGVRCWFAPEDLKIGEHFRNRIDESIRLHDKLLIILSENSIQSPWVATEVESAFEREHRKKDKPVLFPIRLDDSVTKTEQAWAADIRRTRHIGDFTNWRDHDTYQKAFQRLLRDLKADSAKAQEI